MGEKVRGNLWCVRDIYPINGNVSVHTMASAAAHARGLPFSTYAPRGEGGSSLLYISIVYYMQKGGGGGGPDSM